MKNTKNCLLCGVGGQGTVLASKIIAYAAMKRGENVRTSETIGMAQRGGCVVSHVRCGEEISSPLIPRGQADVIIAFEPAEAVRCIDYLAPDGVVIVNKKAVMPTTVNFGAVYSGDDMLAYLRENVKNLVEIDGEELCAECGSSKVLNIVLLSAAAASGMLGMTADELRETTSALVKPKFRSLNLDAIDKTLAKFN